MKSKILISLSIASALFFASPFALAETKLPESSKPMSKVLSDLKMKGYPVITKIEFNDGVYNIKAINSEGKTSTIDFDAQSGEFKTSDNKMLLPAEMIAIKMEGQGFTNIYLIEANDGKFDVKAVNNAGKRMKLEVDGTSGTIINQKED